MKTKLTFTLLRVMNIMKNYGVCLVAAVVLLSSCKEEQNNREGYFLQFMPRKVKNVFITLGEQRFSYWQEFKQVDYTSLLEDSVTEEQFFISILTSNYDPRMDVAQYDPDYDPKTPMPVLYPSSWGNLDDPIHNIEQQIELDYKNQNQNGDLRSSNTNTYDNLIAMEYRTTEIKSIIISSLNTSLFGKPAGESLNDFFTIVQYNPRVIISAPTERLVYGYSSKEYPASIDEWLSLSPFGQAAMYLIPNKKIDSLPLNVQWVVQMETADGLVLSDTTRMITLTK